MNIENLVELIAKRVMEQLVAYQQTLPEVRTDTILVIGKCDDQQQLEQALGKTFSLAFAEDLEAPAPGDYDHVILAGLTNRMLSDLAIGLERGNEGCMVLESLLLGKKVHILKEGIAFHRYKQTARPELYRVFEDKLATICSFGMEVVATDELSSVLAGEKNRNPLPALPEESPQCTPVMEPSVHEKHFKLERRVVGEKDLRRPYEQGYRKIALVERALLTPLAKDFVQMNEDLELIEA